MHLSNIFKASCWSWTLRFLHLYCYDRRFQCAGIINWRPVLKFLTRRIIFYSHVYLCFQERCTCVNLPLKESIPYKIQKSQEINPSTLKGRDLDFKRWQGIFKCSQREFNIETRLYRTVVLSGWWETMVILLYCPHCMYPWHDEMSLIYFCV